MALLEIENLTVEFPTRHQTFVAVDRANLTVEPGQIHGLVGESGAGKSTIGAAVMGLLERPGRIASGIIRFRGEEISGLDAAAMEKLRGKKISMIFQDPLTSLNPLFTVKQQLVETIQAHLGLSDAEADKRAVDLIRRVGIPNPEARANQYPHQFSGGMRQRVVIALALCSEPDVIMAIIAEATLSFLGVGAPPTEPSLGTLIRIGQRFLFSGEWWILFFPALTLLVLALAVNLLGDWLRDALNPRLR